jgi:hypothetical protein
MMDSRQRRAQAEMTTKKHLSKHDREIAAIRKAILVGMRMLNRNEEQISRLTKEVPGACRQRSRADEHLKCGVNGHAKRKLDLQ